MIHVPLAFDDHTDFNLIRAEVRRENGLQARDGRVQRGIVVHTWVRLNLLLQVVLCLLLLDARSSRLVAPEVASRVDLVELWSLLVVNAASSQLS